MRLQLFVIDADRRVQVAWWAQEFGVSEKLLLEAIGSVGRRANAVSAYLKKREMDHSADSHSMKVTTDCLGNRVMGGGTS